MFINTMEAVVDIVIDIEITAISRVISRELK